MKLLKVFILFFISAGMAAYLAFLFVLPNILDLEKYVPQIQKTIEDNTSTKVDLLGVKVKTSYNLSIVLCADKVSLKTIDNVKFAQINNVRINLSLIPFLRKEIKIDKIQADKLMANITKQMLEQKNQSKQAMLQLSHDMPDISAAKYRISFLDGNNNYTFKGQNFVINDFVLNKKLNIKTSGELILNKKKQINYNLAVTSDITAQKSITPNTINDFFNIFNNILKYNIKADIKSDLDIKNKNGYLLNGKAEVDKLSFNLSGRAFPPSSLKLEFNGDKIKINAGLHVDKDSKALITGVFRTNKNKFIDLHVKSDKIKIEDVYSILKTMSTPLNLKDLNSISVKGLLKADFNIKSDFKTIESSGYLKIKNACAIHKTQKIILDKINADIDFSQNSIKINKANAYLNSQPFTIKGSIDKNANADIVAFAKNLSVKSVLFALGQLKLLNENEISNGLVNLNIILKGQMKKTTPKIYITFSNINLKNKKTNAHIKITKATLNSALKNQNKAELDGIKIVLKNQPPILIHKLILNSDSNDIIIPQTYILINNIKACINGKISNFASNPKFNPLIISIPNQISVPLQGFANSRILAKGHLNLNGDINNPQITGLINIPLINIPTASTIIKNASLTAKNEVLFTCPYIKMGNSLMRFSSNVNKNFSDGIVLENANFSGNVIDLNSLGDILKMLPVGNLGPSIIIKNGKENVKIFKVGGFISSNINSDFYLKNNNLYLDNLKCDAYFGKIAGNITHHIISKKTEMNLQGRKLNADTAMQALTGRDDDIHGMLDFDSNLSFYGYSKVELLKSLSGPLIFVISNGQMGVLGKFEHLIYAQNVLSNSIFKATLNLALQALTIKDTGVYRYLKGQIHISNGWANILRIKSCGPSMSLYVKGRYRLSDDLASLTILGRISDDVVNVLGPIGEFSMNKIISFIPKFGDVTNAILDQFTTNRNYENISEIPPLAIQTHFQTKEFKVIIDGNITSQSSVKSFKWISKPQINITPKLSPQNHPQTRFQQQIPDFVKKLPDFKQ